METLKQNTNTLEKYERKHGLLLLVLSVIFSFILVIGTFVYSLSRGCGYEHSFFLCSGIFILMYVFVFITAVSIIISIVQLIKPFFGEKLVKEIFIIYVGMILCAVAFDFVATRLKSTEQECAIVSLYDKKNSEYCYFKLAQIKSDNSYCAKSGPNQAICERDIELYKGK